MVPGPFIMFFNSHGKHTRSEMSGEFGPFREGAQGDEQGLGMTWHCARGERDGEPPAGAGRERGGHPHARRSAVGS